MFLPFSELKIHLLGFDGKFVPSFVNDISRDGSFKNGLLVLETQNKTGYILISGGRAVLSRVAVFSEDGQIFTNIPVDSFLGEKQVDLYLMSVENDSVFKCLSDFLVYPISLYSPYRFVNVPLLVSSFSGTKESGLICFKHGAAMDIAVFDNGNFSFLAAFDSEGNTYTFENNPVKFGSYLGTVDMFNPTVFYIKVSEKVFSSSSFSSGLDFLEKDPVQAESELYFRIFELIFRFFSEKVGKEKMAAFSEKLFAYLRGRYPEIYSSLAYSEEKGGVNWETLLDSRSSIAAEYRFGEYHNYFDEVLHLLIKTAKSLSSPSETGNLFCDIRALVQNSESENTILSGMFDRMDKLLKI